MCKMTKVLSIINPRISLEIKKDGSDKFKEAILYVSKNSSGPPPLQFFSPTRPTCLDKFIEWDELRKKIEEYTNQRYRTNERIEDSWVTVVDGYRNKESCAVEISFYNKTVIRIDCKDILGLPTLDQKIFL